MLKNMPGETRLQKKCKYCQKNFIATDKSIKRQKSRIFCGLDCASKGRWTMENRKKVSRTMKKKLQNGDIKRKVNSGDKHHNWKGGNPDCKKCGKKMSIRNSKTGNCHKCYLSTQVGEKSHLWRGGLTPLKIKIRTSARYTNWRNRVFKRDNYTCQECGSRGGNGKAVVLNADHIKPFSALFYENNVKTIEQASKCKQLWDINNGRTLCLSCHKKTKTYGGLAINFYNYGQN